MRTLLPALLGALVAHAHAHAQPTSDTAYTGGEVLFLNDTPIPLHYRYEPSRTGPGHTTLSIAFEAGTVEVRRPGALVVVADADTQANGIFLAVASSRPASVATLFVRPSDVGRELSFSEIPRVAGRDREPVNVAVTETPAGFTVLWQEASTRDPNDAWSTYAARFDSAGNRQGAPSELRSVPWPIADAAWANGQYFLLLWYSMAPGATRLAAVHVDEAGNPREHPWWASRAASIREAHLVAAGERLLAVYRADVARGELLEADVTTGGWGQEAAEPRALGAIGLDTIYGARWDGRSVVIERRRR